MKKQEIETIAGIKIRKGFDKFLDKSIDYLGINDFNIDNSIKIIMFINSSNSKLSESYWALRCNKTEEESKVLIQNYIDNFVSSSYKNTNRKNIQRKFQSHNNSRGYSGYTEIGSKKYYCRSSHEFVYLHHMSRTLEPNQAIEIEDKMFHIDGESYKPDFFIYRDGILEQVIEVKDNKKEYFDRYQKYETFFNEIGIKFSFVCGSGIILKQNMEIKKLLKEWIEKNATIPIDMRGTNNPNFGNKYTEEQKIKVQKNRMIQQLKYIKNRIDFNVDSFDDIVIQTNNLKELGIINKYMPYSVASFKKYFTDIDTLKMEVL